MSRLRAGLTALALFASAAAALANSGSAGAASTTAETNAAIGIPDSGTATPYPSSINVAGAVGAVTDVRARITGFTHTNTPDVDILLVGPAGQSVVLLSDVGNGADVANLDITFVDGQPAVPSPVTSGRFAPTNNVAGDAFAAPAPAGPHGTALDVFDGTNPNGEWRLFVVDDAGVDVGSIATWSLRIITGVENETPIAVPSVGPANPYPSVINTAGLPGVITSVSVTLTNLTTAFGDDLDVLLVSPDGDRILLMSDAGGSDTVLGSSITFQTGGAVLPDNAGVGPGVYAPANYDGADGDVFPAPAPAGATTTDLTTLDGGNPNGAWQLFVVDDDPGASHTLPRGWSIDVRSEAVAPPPPADPCASPPVTEDGFADVTLDNVHEAFIDCIAFYGIAQGTGPGTYGAFANVSRAQMASFVARLVRVAGGALPANPPDAFPGDDAGPPHELAINQLAAVGVIGGNGETGTSYNVTADMRRDHMASFLAGAYAFVLGAELPAGPDAFPDDDGNAHEADINALAAAAVVQGNNGLYSPAGSVSRSSMGSFLGKTLQQLVEDGATAAPVN